MSESEHTEPQHTEPPGPRHAFEFEGDDDVTDYVAQLPAIKMPTDEPFQRGTLLDLRVRVRVRGFGYDETRSGQVVRIHRLVLEECNIENVVTPAMIRAAVEAEAVAAAQAQDAEHVIAERPGLEDIAGHGPRHEEPERSDDSEQDEWSELSPEQQAERRREDVESWDEKPQEPLVVGEPDIEPADAAEPARYNPGF